MKFLKVAYLKTKQAHLVEDALGNMNPELLPFVLGFPFMVQMLGIH